MIQLALGQGRIEPILEKLLRFNFQVPVRYIFLKTGIKTKNPLTFFYIKTVLVSMI